MFYTNEPGKMYLSFQKINTYSMCGIKYYLRYVKGIVPPISSYIAMGKALHKATQIYLQEKREKEENPDIDLLLSTYSDELKLVFNQEEIYLDEEESTKGREKLIGELEDLGIKSLKVYHRERISGVNPAFIEERFEINLSEIAESFDSEIGRNENIIVVGQIDLIDMTGKIIDLKTKRGGSPPRNEVEKSQQLTIYAAGYKTLFGELPPSVELDYIIISDKSPRVVNFQAKRSEEDIRRLLKRILRVVDGIRKGVFIPPEHTSWACSYCMYRITGHCDEYII